MEIEKAKESKIRELKTLQNPRDRCIYNEVSAIENMCMCIYMYTYVYI